MKLSPETRFNIQITMFGMVCFLIGAIFCFFVTTHQQAEKMEVLVHKLEGQVEKVTDTNEYLRTWKQLTDDRFVEIDGRMLRMEHVMRIPRSQRTAAARRYDAFGAQEDKQ